MRRVGLERDLVDRAVYDRSVGRFREAGIVLPTFGELSDPAKIPHRVREALASVEPDAPSALNLFRVHWYNDAERTRQVDVPEHAVPPTELTGVEARTRVALRDRF